MEKGTVWITKEARIEMRNANGEIIKDFKIDMEQDYVGYKANVDGLWTHGHGLHWMEESTGQKVGISFCSKEQQYMLYYCIRNVKREYNKEMALDDSNDGPCKEEGREAVCPV